MRNILFAIFVAVVFGLAAIFGTGIWTL